MGAARHRHCPKLNIATPPRRVRQGRLPAPWRTPSTPGNGRDRVAGYYALAAGAARQAGLPGSVGRNEPDPVPVVVLGCLAVDRHFQSVGLGSVLVADAVRRVAQAAEIAGVRALVVDALGGAEGFYTGLGFAESPVGSGRLIATVARLIASIARADGAR
jgi:GNAT superfamily N-acetyltransferase